MEGQVISLKQVADGIFLLTMHNNDNRMNPQFFSEFHRALDIAEKEQARGLITTGTGRFFSNGLDIAFLYAHKNDPICRRFFPDYFYPLCSRILMLPYPTVALVNGHAYAGGMVLAMAHDYCTMLGNKSGIKMCMNEIALGSPIPLGMVELLRAKFIKRQQFLEALLKPTVFQAETALECELIQHVGQNVQEMLNWSIDKCKEKKDNVSPSYALVKRALNAPAIEALRDKDDVPIDALFSKL
jgi:enoyl-CoA hydratase/carnithine racemase